MSFSAENISGLMAGKRGLIMGVANDKSIAWGIARTVAAAGAEVAFTYQGEALEKRVRPLAESVGSDTVLACDVTDAASMDAVFETLKEKWGKLDFVVHAIGFSDKNELRGRYVDTSPENFAMSMNISVYSFTAIAQRAEKLMTDGGSRCQGSTGSQREIPCQ
jgi:enoyl-[acyl-carrier protein] reductase I